MLERYRRGTATPEERRFVEAYYVLLGVRGEAGMPAVQDSEDLEEQILRETWAQIDEDGKGERGNATRLRVIRIAASAAVILALLLFGVMRYHRNSPPQTVPGLVQDTSRPAGIHPGGNRAVLTLAGGQRIVLDSASRGLMARQGRTRIINLGNGQLAYEGEGKQTGNPIYNNITTPLGGQYRVTLPDSTVVWLNANSSFDFPAAFTGEDRRVRIKGEAYFEVAKDSRKPFIVEVGELRIRVLGTRFNVAAYGDEATIKTTLSQGLVQVSRRGESHLLKPGQQAGVNKKTGDFQIATVNVKRVLAWKNGLFYFDNTNIRVIMRELARWYNIRVVYETKDFTHKNFSGVVSRYGDVEALLKRLELTDAVHFKIDGNQIIVMD